MVHSAVSSRERRRLPRLREHLSLRRERGLLALARRTAPTRATRG